MGWCPFDRSWLVLVSELDWGTPSTVMQVVKQRFARLLIANSRVLNAILVPCPASTGLSMQNQ